MDDETMLTVKLREDDLQFVFDMIVVRYMTCTDEITLEQLSRIMEALEKFE